MKNTAHIVVAILSLLTLTFCASNGKLESNDAVTIKGVPFFAQDAYQCGPAALATVLNYWYQKDGQETRTKPDQIAAAIYSPTARGVLGIDLEVYAKKQGFNVRQYSGSIEDLKRQVDREMPAIIFVNYGFSAYEANHFMVVKGYTNEGIIANSGKQEDQYLSDKGLDRIWKKNDYWILVVTPRS
jgi:ABC-type bacteriocin/lantibiotic exporter with double-glycine peptidase domain